MARTPKPTASDDRGIGDNSSGLEEAERVQLISVVHQINSLNERVDAAKVVFDAAKKARNAAFNVAKKMFSREEIEDRMREMNRPTFEIVEMEARVARHRRWLGIITPEQREMHLTQATPQAAKTLMDYQSAGYRVGLVAGLRKAPPGVTGEEEQAWLQGYDSGKKDGHDAIAANLKPSVREQAAADFAADNDMDEEAIKKAARKLKNDPKFMDRTAPEEVVDEDPLGANSGFEATAEELEAQRARPSVQDAEAQAQADAENAVV